MYNPKMNFILEGAPATGKSTVSKFLAEHHGFYRIAEVNELFPDRPDPEPEYWYCERQLDRCELARVHQKSILDGDLFQPVWFSWIYPDRGFADWSKSLGFFQSHAESIVLPSNVAHLHIDDVERFERERGREKLRGRNQEQFLLKWSRYSDFGAPQTALFEAMSREYPGWVISLEVIELQSTVRRLLEVHPVTPPTPSEFTRWLADWLGNNSSDSYR